MSRNVDKVTSCFSPLDVRILTYLGYLGINSPQYKLLAEKLSKDTEITFSVAQKGKKQLSHLTASEILEKKEVLQNFDKEDVAKISYHSCYVFD